MDPNARSRPPPACPRDGRRRLEATTERAALPLSARASTSKGYRCDVCEEECSSARWFCRRCDLSVHSLRTRVIATPRSGRRLGRRSPERSSASQVFVYKYIERLAVDAILDGELMLAQQGFD